MKEMRDWEDISRNKIVCNLIHWEHQVQRDFRMRHRVIDNLGRQTCLASIREYRIWKQIGVKYGIE